MEDHNLIPRSVKMTFPSNCAATGVLFLYFVFLSFLPYPLPYLLFSFCISWPLLLISANLAQDHLQLDGLLGYLICDAAKNLMCSNVLPDAVCFGRLALPW